MHSHVHTHLEAAELCVLPVLPQGAVDPVEDDLISDFIPISHIWQNRHRVPVRTASRIVNSNCATTAAVSKPLQMGTSPTAFLPPHQLPDQRQGVQPAALVQVLSPDADQREVSHVPAQLHRVVAVLQLRRKRKIQLLLFILPFKKCVFSAFFYVDTFFMLTPRMGYGGLLTFFQFTGTLTFS